jgi:hypothetical protein
VRKAIKLALRHLLKAGEEEEAFARQIEDALSLGYKCLYSRPAGQRWGGSAVFGN